MVAAAKPAQSQEVEVIGCGCVLSKPGRHIVALCPVAHGLKAHVEDLRERSSRRRCGSSLERAHRSKLLRRALRDYRCHVGARARIPRGDLVRGA